jgi:putative acetyltransferase
MDGITVRPEAAADIPEITRVVKAAFGRDVEDELVVRLRERNALTISLVAIENGAVVGHIAFSPVTTDPAVPGVALACLAPVAVEPGLQKRGIGGLLVTEGVARCRETGCDAVFLVGHADYYPRFGFTRANEYGITCEFEAPDEAWMVIELTPGTLEKLRGAKVLFHPVFGELV